LLAGLRGLEDIQVPAGQFLIARHTGVCHGTVDTGDHPELTAPVFGCENAVQAGQVRLCHVHESSLA
jgi:hypothetical protein